MSAIKEFYHNKICEGQRQIIEDIKTSKHNKKEIVFFDLWEYPFKMKIIDIDTDIDIMLNHYEKIESIISSCKTLKQTTCLEIMINTFNKKFLELNWVACGILCIELRRKINQKVLFIQSKS